MGDCVVDSCSGSQVAVDDGVVVVVDRLTGRRVRDQSEATCPSPRWPLARTSCWPCRTSPAS